LLTALLALITEEEWIHMVERALELEDELMAESPFLRRIRDEGREEGRTAGSLTAWQRAILETLAVRFTFPEAMRDSVEQRLATITDEAQLATLHTVAVQSTQLTDFLASLEGIAQG
jgi:predicted transposase YdaD